MNLGSDRIGGFPNGHGLDQCAAFGIGGFPGVGQNNALIGQNTAPPPAKGFDLVKVRPGGHAHSPGKAGELLVLEIDFHAVNVGIRITHERTQIRNFLIHFVHALHVVLFGHRIEKVDILLFVLVAENPAMLISRH